MFSQLAIPIALFSLMLLVPGYFAARAITVPRLLALCTAPVVTVGLVSVLGEVYAIAKIPATPLAVFAPIIVLSLILLLMQYAVVRKRGHLPTDERMSEISPLAPILFILIGLFVANGMFLSSLDSPNAVMQAYDNTHHLNTIQAFFDSKRISSIGVTPFLTPADAAIRPYGVVATYPSAWYALCALLMQLTPISAAASINVSMAVFTGVVLPLGMLAWSSFVFEHETKSVYVTALTSVAFVTFPWCMLLFGPLYPNLAGFACIPATAALFMALLHSGFAERSTGSHSRPRRRKRITLLTKLPYVLLLLAALDCQAFMHPNTLFALFLILVPYCAWRLYRYSVDTRQLEGIRSCVLPALFLALCLGFWVLCYKSPAFSAIVGEFWPDFAYSWQEVINIVTQTYTLGFFAEIATQVVLAALVVIGWVRCLYDSKLRWLAVAYLIVCWVNFVAAVSTNVTLKQFFAGFWYTDAMRLAAMAVIVAVLLAAHGFSWVYEIVCGAVSAYNTQRQQTTHPRVVAAVLSTLFLVLNFMPGFNWPGAHSPLTPKEFDELKREGREYETLTFKTAYGDYKNLMRSTYLTNKPIDDAERRFLEEVALIVPTGELIINNPMDGSFLAYGGQGLRVYYREFGYAGSSFETPESVLVRTKLSEIASNTDVQKAVETIGGKYVLVLSEQNSPSSFINLRGDYSSSEYAGISSITPYTQGFTPLLTNGACTLYKIG